MAMFDVRGGGKGYMMLSTGVNRPMDNRSVGYNTGLTTLFFIIHV